MTAPARKCAHCLTLCDETYCPDCGRSTRPADCRADGKKIQRGDGWMTWTPEKKDEEKV